MSKIDHSLFQAHEHALQEAFGECPECGGALLVKHSKKGAFIGCANYPDCTHTQPLHETETAKLKVMEGSACPLCTAPLAIKKGRYGLFVGCTRFPDCHHMEPIKKNDDTHLNCPSCGKGHLLKRANKFGKSFYACNQYPKCRYALNDEPVKASCPDCGWNILIKKRTARGVEQQCPQKNCGYKTVVEPQ